jgi:hypothetical protein
MLTADVSSYSLTTVKLAVAMAVSVNTRLQVLFIEDEDLLQVAGLPCSREITLTSARERPTSTDLMQRSLHSLTQHFKQTLQQQARDSQIAWSFDTVRGRVRDIGLKPDSDATYTILGHPLTHRLQAGRTHGARRILIISNDSAHQQQALEMLLRRFSHEKTELWFVGDDRETELSPEMAKQIKNSDYDVKLIGFDREKMAELLDSQGSSFDCAIVSKHEQIEELIPILKKLNCPVILVA